MTEEEQKRQEEFNRIMDDYNKSEKEHYEKVNRHNQRVLHGIRAEKGDEFYGDLLFLMEESEVCDFFKIVAKPKGEYQEEDYEYIPGTWVVQCAVGESGDSWAGTVTVKINEEKYLEMPFSM